MVLLRCCQMEALCSHTDRALGEALGKTLCGEDFYAGGEDARDDGGKPDRGFA